ncbi:hypothetical protein OG787_47620 [Streptomyces sp. NBC_00075]|uniref:hypothetical protein n=1 Tax=Streptomyces sp. NBC_00075 TaxID=2975641 RepID=UPI00324C649E
MRTTPALHRVALAGAVRALAATPHSASSTVTRVDATDTAATVAPAREGSPRSAVDRVADFYGAYIDVLYDSGRTTVADALRGHYLTARLRTDLARWEKEHRTDGMLRAEGVPVAWEVGYNDSGMGHCWTRVTLTWEDHVGRSHRTHLMVQSDLGTGLISGVRTDGQA